MPYEMVNKVAELENELRRMREDVDIWDLLSEHRLPYGHERRLRAMVASMEERTSFTEIMASSAIRKMLEKRDCDVCRASACLAFLMATPI